MTADRRAETLLPPILDELASGSYPDYVEDVVRMTAGMRQRPSWTFGQVWLGRLGLGRVGLPARGVRWRLVTVAVLVAALLLTAVFILTAGSRRSVPPPFGPARNGLITLERSGDIVVVDPVTRLETVLVGGPTRDLGPRFSPDGTRILFERKRDDGRSEVWTVSVRDGTMTLLTREPILLAPGNIARAWERYTMSPDGTTVAIAISGTRGPGIAIAQADGSSFRELDVGRAATEPSYRPPDGRELLFVGRSQSENGIFAVDLVTSKVRAIAWVQPPRDLAGASWSPDGSRIAYWSWSNAIDGLTAKSHIVLADGSGDRLVPSPPGAVWNAHATWSNDGTRLFVVHGFDAKFGDVRGYILPADGSTAGIEVAPAGFAETECCAAWIWSPDDTRILGRPGPEGAQQVIIDVEKRTARIAPWTAAGDPAWQRLAP